MRLRNTHRRGVSLVEMIVAIFVLSTVLTLSVAILNAMFRLESDIQRHTDTRAATAHLARQFRRDVHAATGRIDPLPPKAIVALDLGSGHVVMYRLLNYVPTRVETTPDGKTKVERFPLPARTFTVEPLDGDGPETLRLTIDRRPAGRTKGVPHWISIDAILAADHRFTLPTTETSDAR